MDEAGRGAAAEELWRFSLAVYARPGVAETCLALQDEHGVDVNLLLFALWRGASGRGPVAAAELEAAEAAVAPWRRNVILPLRGVRRFLKGRGATALRERVKAAELDAEREAQRLIVGVLAPSRGESGDSAAAGAASAAVYLAWAGVPEAANNAAVECLRRALSDCGNRPPGCAS